MPLMEWQKWVVEDMMKIDEQGAFRRKTIGLLIARQNGKTHLARMRIIWGLLNGERIVAMSSNRNMALDNFREVSYIIQANDFLAEQLAHKPRLANGQEMITFKNGGRYEIVAATRDGSRGETADLLFIDELREVTLEAWTAARPVTRARPNAQTLVTSNAGDAFSQVLNDLRERALWIIHRRNLVGTNTRLLSLQRLTIGKHGKRLTLLLDIYLMREQLLNRLQLTQLNQPEQKRSASGLIV